MKKVFWPVLLVIMLALTAATLAALMQKISAGSKQQPEVRPSARPAGTQSPRKVEFSMRLPASSAEITGDFTNWKRVRMNRQDEHNWYAVFELEPGSYGYNFVVDGRTYLDPKSQQKGKNPEGGICSVKDVK